MFKNWYNPYPKEETKNSLMLKTGLTKIQLNNWFVNARRRFLKRYLEKDENRKLIEIQYPKPQKQKKQKTKNEK